MWPTAWPRRSSSRTWNSGSRRRGRPPTGSNSSSRSSGNRSKRPKPRCSSIASRTTRYLARGSPEHRRAEARRPQRRRDQAKTERLQKEAIYRQLSRDPDATLRRSTRSRRSRRTSSSSSRRQSSPTLQRQRAQLAEKLGERHPDMLRLQSAIRDVAGEARRRDRQGRPVRANRISGGAGAGTKPDVGARSRRRARRCR